MKKILLILALVSALCLVFASCNKDKGDGKDKNDDITLGETVKVTFTAKGVNGQNADVTNADISIVKYPIVGAKLEAPEEPTKDGYTFEGWFMGDIEWDFDEMVVAEEMELTAEWSAKITYVLGSGINADNNPQKIYTNGTYPITLNAPTRDGYAFGGWYTDSALTTPISTIESCKAYTVYAKWNEGTMVDYTVKVQSEGGMPLANVWVYIHKGEGNNEIDYKKTDANGIATFSLLTPSDYSIQLDGAPNGYTVTEGLTKADRYPLTSTETVISLTSAPTATAKNGMYNVGDVMHDFEITDIDGKTHKLSDILKEKDMVMLNFWYTTCGYCVAEFPHINSAYNKHKDNIEIIAINDYVDSNGNSESISKITSFRDNKGLDFPVAKVVGDPNMTIGKITGSTGWPTTVIIDRYGVIVAIIVGYIPTEAGWNQLFEDVTGDDYKQKLMNSSDIAYYRSLKDE